MPFCAVIITIVQEKEENMTHNRFVHMTLRASQFLSLAAAGLLVSVPSARAEEATESVTEPVMVTMGAEGELVGASVIEANVVEEVAADSKLVQAFSEATPRFLLADAAAAAPSMAASGEKTAETKGAEAKDSEDGFHRGLRERGIFVSYGKKIPINRFETRTDVTVYQVVPHWGRFRNSRQEISWELPLIYASSPHHAYAFGPTLMGRQYLSDNKSFAPFLELGCGIVYTNFNEKFGELGGHFQFSPQGGIGARTKISKNGDLVYGVRWFHFSNAGLDSPNTGLNNYLFNIGYSQLF